MKISYYSQLNYLPRTAIGREQKQFIKIAFAVHLSAVISAERYRSDSGALKSAMLTLVYFYIIMIVHKCQQSAKRKLLLNKNSLSEVFPLTVGNGKTMAFENRHDGCKEREKINRRRTLCTLRINFFEATPQTACIFSKEVEGYINTSSKYETSQSYSYDNLYQLIKAEGTHKQYGGINPNPDNPHPSNPLHTNKYRQTFAFDIIGNMTNKSSTTNIQGGSISSDDTKLNYEPDYEYDSKYAHRLIRAGNRYYRYDANGNITAEKDGSFTDKEDFTFTYSYFAEHDVYGVDYGFDLEPPEDDPANLESGGTTSTTPTGGYRRDYTWNERNLLIKSDDKLNTVIYRYGDDGQRALKFTQQSNSETLYFNNFYSVHQVAHEPNHEHGLRVSKHIFVGNSRLVTAMTHADNHGDTTEQTEKRYYYHADHLQSAQFITDVRGEQYEHIEYTPYGELWIEETAPGIDKLPFRFTGKELDEETGLYYYGARYLDPKYSRWLSGDPALNDYIPKAPIDDEAKKHNENLPGIGGVYNTINLHVYHYAGNNPVKYTDPDGRDIILLNRSYGAGGFGHNAVLIGNDTDGWYYYSKDGKADGNQNGIRFDNLNAFRQANNKVVGKNNEYGASFNYDKGYQLKTTPEEDAQMQAYAAGRVNKDYSLFAENTEQFLDFSGGWKQRPSWKSIALEDNKAENCADFSGKVIEFGGKGAFFPNIFGATIPNTQYKNFKNAHPKGKILNFNPLPPGEYNYEKVDRMYEYMYGL